jgi:hypothetical protein
MLNPLIPPAETSGNALPNEACVTPGSPRSRSAIFSSIPPLLP